MDWIASHLFLVGDRSLVVPSSLQEVSDNFCPKIQENIEKIREIARSCLRPFPKQLVGVMLFAIKRVNREICSSKQEKDFIVQHLSCVRDQNKMEQVHVLMDDFVKFAHYVHSNVSDTNKKIPFICCQYLQLMQDLDKRLSNWCKREAIDYVINMIDKMMSDCTDMICPQYVKPGSLTAPDGKCRRFMTNNPVPLNPKVKSPTLSMLPPLIDIFTEMGSLPEES
jgi:hypothetical protein